MDQVIIIFTKDRPSILANTINHIPKTQNIIVLDDSWLKANRNKNRKSLSRWGNVEYHGRQEQRETIRNWPVKPTKIQHFVRNLGVKGWNLGYARNYAILLAKFRGGTKLILLDDDISIADRRWFSATFRKLGNYRFVGSKVIAMPDDSVIGHIARKLNFELEEFFSGGCMAFRLNKIDHFFLNEYNEDWIWIYLQFQIPDTFEFGKAIQQPFDPFLNGLKKAKKQEWGELLVDGIREASIKRRWKRLLSESFWKRIIQEKLVYYGELTDLAIQKKEMQMLPMIRAASKKCKGAKPKDLKATFARYFKDKKTWKQIINQLNKANEHA
jgi:hypothetical protein